MKSIYIDINCDLGEGVSQQDCALDELLMAYVSSCNIACGGHAGNERTMRESLRNATKNQLKIGAHPGYPDKDKFGRSSMELTEVQLEKTIVSQIDSLLNIAAEEHIDVQHIKFHGALYNDAESNPALATQLTSIIQQYYPSKKVVGLAGGTLEAACKVQSLTFIAEGFMDRTYLSNGKLTSRTESGAIIEDQNHNINQAIALATNQPIICIDNHTIQLQVDTICLHSDNPNALSLVKQLRQAFNKEGITIQ